MPPLLVPHDGHWVPVGDWLTENRAARRVMRLPGTYTRAEFEARQALKDSQFFLVKNDGGMAGEPLVCLRCGAGRYPTKPHTYFTLFCKERPFKGLEKALFAWAKVRSDDDLKRRILSDYPDLEVGHPVLARHLRPIAPGEDLIAVAIGTAIPITKTYADNLTDVINGIKRPRRPEDYFAP